MGKVQLEHIIKRYNRQVVLKDITIEVDTGEVLVLLGTSGSGKTTLLKMINGLVKPDEGHVRIKGEYIEKLNLKNVRKEIGYVIQGSGLFPHYTVFENIAVVPRLLKWNEDRIAEKVKSLMELLKLDFRLLANKMPNELSGGQAQRVGIARALAADAELLLMDEPFGALDPITRAEIRTDFKAIQEERKITTVLVTHDVLEAILLADRICFLSKGEIQQIGTPKELLFKPANAFVKSFLDQDRFQAELAAVSMKDVAYEVEENHRSILSCLTSSESINEKALLEAFYAYKNTYHS
jgi:osmoprotectant transport system ATP-binding protein